MHAELRCHLWTVAGWLLQCLEAHCCLCRLLQQRSIRWFLVCRQPQLIDTGKQCMRYMAKCRSGRHCSPFDSHKLRCICRYLVCAAIGLPNDWLQGALLLAHFNLTARKQEKSCWLMQLFAPVTHIQGSYHGREQVECATRYPVFFTVTKACFSPFTSNITVSPSVIFPTGAVL